MRLALAALLIAGCYSPSPPGGGFRCGTDGACPSTQHCICGLCVYEDSEAACAFAVEVPPNASFAEHQKFPITVRALQANGVAASGFGGEVSLTATWGDVRPDKVKLNNGSASIMVSLNRETVKPQSAVIKATFGDNKGTSGKVFVHLPTFTRDPTPIAPPATQLSPWGWADFVAAQPDVIKTPTGYRMYFIGVGTVSQGKAAVGSATSTDGKTFAPASQPVLMPTAQIEPLIGTAAFNGPFGPSMLLGVGAGTGLGKTFSGAIAVATSTDGIAPFKLGNNGKPVIATGACQYCKSAIGFPSIIADPFATNSDGTAGGWFMFFSALEERPNFPLVSIGRATSTDGVNFVPEAAPLLESDIFGELVMLSPHVLLDGTVLKMWYSFTKTSDNSRASPDFCGTDPRDRVEVGYATASYANPSDGLFWVRSQSNPVLTIGGGGWDNDNRAILVGSVLPLDGNDPASGVQLYYSTYRRQGFLPDTCAPDGIGRATRM
jgi:hypothetical protein